MLCENSGIYKIELHRGYCSHDLQDFAQKYPQLPKDEAEFLAGDGEDGVEAVAEAALELGHELINGIPKSDQL